VKVVQSFDNADRQLANYFPSLFRMQPKFMETAKDAGNLHQLQLPENES